MVPALVAVCRLETSWLIKSPWVVSKATEEPFWKFAELSKVPNSPQLRPFPSMRAPSAPPAWTTLAPGTFHRGSDAVVAAMSAPPFTVAGPL